MLEEPKSLGELAAHEFTNLVIYFEAARKAASAA